MDAQQLLELTVKYYDARQAEALRDPSVMVDESDTPEAIAEEFQRGLDAFVSSYLS